MYNQTYHSTLLLKNRGTIQCLKWFQDDPFGIHWLVLNLLSLIGDQLSCLWATTAGNLSFSTKLKCWTPCVTLFVSRTRRRMEITFSVLIRLTTTGKHGPPTGHMTTPTQDPDRNQIVTSLHLPFFKKKITAKDKTTKKSYLKSQSYSN